MTISVSLSLSLSLILSFTHTHTPSLLGATTFSIRFKLLLQTFGTIRENLLVSYQPHMGNGKTRPDKGRFQDYRTGTFLSTNESKNMTGLRLVSKLWPVKSFYRGVGTACAVVNQLWNWLLLQ